MSVRHRGARIVGGLAAAVLLVLGPVCGTAAPAFAAGAIDDAASAFASGQHVYVAPGVGTRLDLDQVRAAARQQNVYVAVLPESVVTDVGGIRPLTQQVASTAGTDKNYVVASPDGFGVAGPGRDGNAIYEQAKAAGGGPTAEVLFAINALGSPGHGGGAVEGGGGSGPSAGLIIALIFVVILVIAVVRVSRRNRRNRGGYFGEAVHHHVDLATLRADVTSEIQTLQDDLLITDPAGATGMPGAQPTADDAAERALQVAWARHGAAVAMLGSAANEADLERARLLAEQGRAALEHAQRLRDGVPGESEVYRLAAQRGGPDPQQREDAPSDRRSKQQRMLPQWTAASYPGYGYGWYPGYGWGFFNYGGSFVAGMLAGELLDDAFVASPWAMGAMDGGMWGADVGGGGWGGDMTGGDVGGGGWGGDVGGGGWGGGDIGGGGWGGGGGDAGGGGW